jgi:uncharacterized DUF497 family protein
MDLTLILTGRCEGAIFIPLMRFEFDPAKSAANKKKHGIDFVAAQELWEDEDRLQVTITGLSEPRWLLIGRFEGRTWTAVFTVRGDNLRLISVRRARDQEKEQYDQDQEDDGGGI